MASYKEMTDRQILNKYYYYISKVNIYKKYYPNNLTTEERKKVKKYLIKDLKVNNDQADYMLTEMYRKDNVKKSVRDTLLLMENKDTNLNKYLIISTVRYIKRKAIKFWIISVLCLLFIIFINFALIMDNANLDAFLGFNLLFTLNIILLDIFTLHNYGYFIFKKFDDKDEIGEISGYPTRVSIIYNYRLSSQTNNIRYLSEPLYIIYTFKVNNKKYKLYYLLSTDLFYLFINNNIREIKKILKNKFYKIEYYKNTKYIKSINHNISKYIRKC